MLHGNFRFVRTTSKKQQKMVCYAPTAYNFRSDHADIGVAMETVSRVSNQMISSETFFWST